MSINSGIDCITYTTEVRMVSAVILCRVMAIYIREERDNFLFYCLFRVGNYFLKDRCVTAKCRDINYISWFLINHNKVERSETVSVANSKAVLKYILNTYYLRRFNLFSHLKMYPSTILHLIHLYKCNEPKQNH